MILECADEAHKHGGYLIADGGVRPSRDVSIDLAAEADYVMIGSMFAGTYESPPDIQYDENGKPFKVNFGMASVRASNNRTFGQSRTSDMDLFRDVIGHRGEGISEQRVYLQPGRNSVALLHHYYMDGVSSGVTYAGARSVREYPHKAIMTIQMPSGYREGEAKAKL
jgi:IMP dehydrogenase